MLTAATGVSSNKAINVRQANPVATKTSDGTLLDTAVNKEKSLEGGMSDTMMWAIGIGAIALLWFRSRA